MPFVAGRQQFGHAEGTATTPLLEKDSYNKRAKIYNTTLVKVKLAQ
jgi:hypothetical protein